MNLISMRHQPTIRGVQTLVADMALSRMLTSEILEVLCLIEGWKFNLTIKGNIGYIQPKMCEV